MKKIFATLFAAVLASSCIELDREDSRQIGLDNFLKTESDVELYVMSLYRPFNSSNGDADIWGFYATLDAGYYAMTEYTTDIMTTDKVTGQAETARAIQCIRHLYAPTSTSNQVMTPLTQKYFPQLTRISKSRMAYLRIRSLDFLSEEARRAYCAEALATAGWTGMILYDIFGPLSIPTDEELLAWNGEPESGIWLPRLDREAYLDYLIDCLEEAIPDLPEQQSMWGRITKGAGRMLFLRLCLMKGTEDAYQRALPVARDLYAQGSNGGGATYALNDSYADIFQVDLSAEKEIILAIPCDGTKDYSPNQWYGQVMPADYPKVSPSAVPSPGHRMRWAFYDTFERGDQRIANTTVDGVPYGAVVAEYVSTAGVRKTRTNGLETGALPFKYQPDPEMTGNFARNDIPVFRYAEAILIYAECEAEVNGVTARAVDLVNEVRARAGLTGLSYGMSLDEFREAILTERGHELFCEGVRHMDLVRHDLRLGQPLGTTWAERGKTGLDAESQARYDATVGKYVFPIPPDYVLKSSGVIEQNEAYK